VDGVSYSLERGRTLGIVGESGSGKSVTSLAVMGLHQGSSAQISGHIRLDGEELVGAPPARVRELRGDKMAMIFQDPLSSLHPYFSVGSQIVEAYRVHHPDATKKQARQRAVDMLGRVGIPEPSARVDDYPHQFSGGMRQRVMIAMALSCNPDILVADEPTTALDVTIQAQILNLIRKLKDEFDTAVVLITHDMGVVADLADRIAVMYAGRIIEKGTRRDIFYDPQHPYTWGLLGSIARLDRPKPRRLAAIPGLPPSLLRLPGGCAFGARCTHRFALCDERPELLDKAGNGHLDACHLEPRQKQELRETTIHPELIEEAT
jgi:peptide/nickel transport system ATP-binding protein